jgi:hypothetical protein
MLLAIWSCLRSMSAMTLDHNSFLTNCRPRAICPEMLLTGCRRMQDAQREPGWGCSRSEPSSLLTNQNATALHVRHFGHVGDVGHVSQSEICSCIAACGAIYSHVATAVGLSTSSLSIPMATSYLSCNNTVIHLRLCRDKTSTMYLSTAARTACIFFQHPRPRSHYSQSPPSHKRGYALALACHFHPIMMFRCLLLLQPCFIIWNLT